MWTVVCIGGGRFGTKAAEEARREAQDCPARSIITRSAERPEEILSAKVGEVLLLRGDGISCLLNILASWTPDLVVPAMRGHMAALLAVRHASRSGAALAPFPNALSALLEKLPERWVKLVDAENGVVVTSHMEDGGACIEDCMQPPVCPITGKERLLPMHQLVSSALGGTMDSTAVLVTASLGTVGGVPGRSLRSMLELIDGLDHGMTVGISTTCRCHAVTNLMHLE